MPSNTKIPLVLLGLLLCGWAAACVASPTPTPSADWRADWEVDPGFAISRDITGLRFPTALAFIPHPGSGPKDPLYFVTELEGKVKVVSNDRTVSVFADLSSLIKQQTSDILTSSATEVGLAGICLAPEQGYVFVTYSHFGADGRQRNAVTRLQSTPQTFGLNATSAQDIAPDISNSPTSEIGNHQIGGCAVDGNRLFIGVGDGGAWQSAQSLNSALGKVLRVDLDGLPLPDNPFYKDGTTGIQNSVWAYGLRNPFGLAIVNGQLYASEDGDSMDRFNQIERGGNYLWNGSDTSIAARADVAFAPVIAPAQLSYLGKDSIGFPAQYSDKFFIASVSEPQDQQRPDKAGVVLLNYDRTTRKAVEMPRRFLQYRGEAEQRVAGVAVGPDGLYALPIYPDSEGQSAVLRITYDPGHAHPYTNDQNRPADVLLSTKGCYGCHSIGGEGGTSAPHLDNAELRADLQQRLQAQAYRDLVTQLDARTDSPFVEYRDARQAVLAARDQAQLVLWTKYHLLEPSFDNPNAQMPNLGLSETEAQTLADYLVAEPDGSLQGRYAAWLRTLPPSHYSYAAIAAVAAFVLGIAVTLLAVNLWQRGKRRG